jgi:hypothetical protein
LGGRQREAAEVGARGVGLWGGGLALAPTSATAALPGPSDIPEQVAWLHITKGVEGVKLTLTHRLHDSLELHYAGQTLFRYVYEPNDVPLESPRPYFHPLRTLRGNEVTSFRPDDHLWHKGLSMTASNLSGQNFWGDGPTSGTSGTFSSTITDASSTVNGKNSLATPECAGLNVWSGSRAMALDGSMKRGVHSGLLGPLTSQRDALEGIL